MVWRELNNSIRYIDQYDHSAEQKITNLICVPLISASTPTSPELLCNANAGLRSVLEEMLGKGIVLTSSGAESEGLGIFAETAQELELETGVSAIFAFSEQSEHKYFERCRRSEKKKGRPRYIRRLFLRKLLLLFHRIFLAA